MAAHRQTVRMRLRASDHPILSRVVNEPTLRVMVFCAIEGHGRQDIAFPHQSEIKVNGGEVKANLRGLKNKPGSTRPVDITKDLRLKIPTYLNTVEMTYALTTKVISPSEITSNVLANSVLLFLLSLLHEYLLRTEILPHSLCGEDCASARLGQKIRKWSTNNQGISCQ